MSGKVIEGKTRKWDGEVSAGVREGKVDLPKFTRNSDNAQSDFDPGGGGGGGATEGNPTE